MAPPATHVWSVWQGRLPTLKQVQITQRARRVALGNILARDSACVLLVWQGSMPLHQEQCSVNRVPRTVTALPARCWIHKQCVCAIQDTWAMPPYPHSCRPLHLARHVRLANIKPASSTASPVKIASLPNTKFLKPQARSDVTHARVPN